MLPRDVFAVQQTGRALVCIGADVGVGVVPRGRLVELRE